MVVDDSAFIRGLVSRWIDGEPDLAVVASLRTGRDAVNQIERVMPDVAVLDIEMPDLDGIAALPLLLAKKRDLIVIMASTLTRRNAEVSLKALSLGAADYIPKPETTRELTSAETFRHDLVQKIRHLGARTRRAGKSTAAPSLAPEFDRSRSESREIGPLPSLSVQAPIETRALSMFSPRVLLIGSSTGGPQALMTLVGGIGAIIDRYPVLITQHMPPTFTTILAEHLARTSRRPAAEGVAGEVVKAGQIYLAPGGKHMKVARHGSEATIVLDDGPAVNFCKPAVDPLFQSAIDVWQHGIMAVILTGMGSDGMRGGRDVVAAGGNVIAQDEATSVVWGMPGAAAHAGICTAVLPLNQIAPKLIRIFSGER
jgi:two-component system, chemotaxis family, protein-glutamate methylesterase/glutaminase